MVRIANVDQDDKAEHCSTGNRVFCCIDKCRDCLSECCGAQELLQVVDMQFAVLQSGNLITYVQVYRLATSCMGGVNVHSLTCV